MCLQNIRGTDIGKMKPGIYSCPLLFSSEHYGRERLTIQTEGYRTSKQSTCMLFSKGSMSRVWMSEALFSEIMLVEYKIKMSSCQ